MGARFTKCFTAEHGHKFHFKCLCMWETKIDKGDNCYKCPYCRQEYSKMKLRKTITIRTGYSYNEYLIERNFCKITKSYLNKIENTKNFKSKTLNTLEMYKLISHPKYTSLIIKKKRVYKNFVECV